MQCIACHSVDYIPMNSRFLDKAGWTADVNKMINVFGAPIPKDGRRRDRELPRAELRQAGRRSSPSVPGSAWSVPGQRS